MSASSIDVAAPPRRFRRHLARVALLALAFLAPPLVAGGITAYLHLRISESLDAAPTAVGLPAPRPPDGDRPLAVIVAGNHGTEITDSLPLVELLEDSEAFDVRVVAPARVPSPFRTSAGVAAGADFVPDLSFAELDDATGGRAPALIVIPYLPAWRHDDAAVVPWIRAHTGPSTMLLSICAGAEVAAATGLYDGHRATADAPLIPILRPRHPTIAYQGGVRWVRDGNRMSSGTLTAGLDATLAAIDVLAGRAAALRAAARTAYPHVRFLDDPAATIARSQLGIALEVAFRWERTRLAIAIADGDSEADVAALLDVSGATFTTDPIAIARRPGIVRTRHGVALVPRDTIDHAATYDAFAIAGLPHPGRHAYDVAIAGVAARDGRPMARSVAAGMNDPTTLDLDGGVPLGLTMAARAVALGLLGVTIAELARRRVRNARARRASLPA